MKRKQNILTGLLCSLILSSICMLAWAVSPRNVNITFDVQSNRNIQINHKAFSGLIISGVVSDSVAQATIDITGATGSIGFKTSLASTSFLAEAAIVLTDPANGAFTCTFPQAQWNTNIVNKLRYWGDVRISTLGNPLPTIELWLYPSANRGSETAYVSPATAGFETNAVLVEPLNRVNFGSDFDASYSSSGGTNKLTLNVSSSVDSTFTNYIEVAGNILQLIGTVRGGTNVINLTTNMLVSAGMVDDIALAAVSNAIYSLTYKLDGSDALTAAMAMGAQDTENHGVNFRFAAGGLLSVTGSDGADGGGIGIAGGGAGTSSGSRGAVDTTFGNESPVDNTKGSKQILLGNVPAFAKFVITTNAASPAGEIYTVHYDGMIDMHGNGPTNMMDGTEYDHGATYGQTTQNLNNATNANWEKVVAQNYQPNVGATFVDQIILTNASGIVTAQLAVADVAGVIKFLTISVNGNLFMTFLSDGTQDISLSQALAFAADNTKDIGGRASGRARDIHAGRYVYAGDEFRGSVNLNTNQIYGGGSELASGANVEIDWDTGNLQTITMDENIIFTFANVKTYTTYMLLLRQDNTGSRTVTWPAGIHWFEGATPVLSTTGDRWDMITFAVFDDASEITARHAAYWEP